MNSLEKQIDCLTWKVKGTQLEYEYVNKIKEERIMQAKKEKEEMTEKQKKQFKEETENLEKELRQTKLRLEQIENSRWWKLRNLLRK